MKYDGVQNYSFTFSENFCSPNPCKNSGRCRSVGRTFHCDCPDGWTGAQCDIKRRPCESAPCLNNGDCIGVSDSAFVCQCQPEFRGTHCENAAPSCPPDFCQNNGTCISDEADSYWCFCTADFSGETCDSSIESSNLLGISTWFIVLKDLYHLTINWQGKTCSSNYFPFTLCNLFFHC